MRYRWGISLLFVLGIVSVAQACRGYQPIGYYVRATDTIVIGDTHRGGEHGFDTLVSVTEVIKGDPTLVGTEIVLEQKGCIGDPRVPTPATGVAIFIHHDEKDPNRKPVVIFYAKPQEIAAVRELLSIYHLPVERQQLMALREKALTGDKFCMEQLLTDMRNIRQPENFDLVIDLYGKLPAASEVELLEFMGNTCDLRALPTLIKAMQSSDDMISNTAARRLYFNFPGAPGVTEAFETVLPRKNLEWFTVGYLSKRREDASLDAYRRPDSPWQRAEKLWNSGNKEGARKAYMDILEGAEWNSYTFETVLCRLLPDASPGEKDRIRKAALPHLLAMASGDNYLHTKAAAVSLRLLRHSDCQAALLSIIPRTDFLNLQAARVATMAIGELGPEARQLGFSHLIGRLTANMQLSEATVPYLLEVIYLADKQGITKATDAMPVSWLATWKMLSPLYAVSDNIDEGALLIRVLEGVPEMPQPAREWIVFRLGDLKENRAVKLLSHSLVSEPDWRLNPATVKESLVNIGSVEVEQQMLPLLTSEDRYSVRAAAIEILFRLQGARALDLARRMLREDGFGLKTPAMNHIATFGTADDLPLLLAHCDFWKADRAAHYGAVSALACMRDRLDYDINGPIVKTATKK